MDFETRNQLTELTNDYFLSRGRNRTYIKNSIVALAVRLLPDKIEKRRRAHVAHQVLKESFELVDVFPPTETKPIGMTYYSRAHVFLGILHMIEQEGTTEIVDVHRKKSQRMLAAGRGRKQKSKKQRTNKYRKMYEELEWEMKALRSSQRRLKSCIDDLRGLREDPACQELWKPFRLVEAYLHSKQISKEYFGERFLRDSIDAGQAFLQRLNDELTIVQGRMCQLKEEVLGKTGGWLKSPEETIWQVLKRYDDDKKPLNGAARKLAQILHKAQVIPVRPRKNIPPSKHTITRITDQILKVYQRR